jgi:hypothetical protein
MYVQGTELEGLCEWVRLDAADIEGLHTLLGRITADGFRVGAVLYCAVPKHGGRLPMAAHRIL